MADLVDAVLAPDTCEMLKKLVKTLVDGLDVPGGAEMYQKMLLSEECAHGKVTLSQLLKAFDSGELNITGKISNFTNSLPDKIPTGFYETAQDVLRFLTEFTGKTGDEIYDMLREYVPKIFGSDGFNPIKDISSNLQDSVPSFLKKYVTFEKPSDVTQKANIIYALVVPVPLLVLIFTLLAAILWWPCCVKC